MHRGVSLYAFALALLLIPAINAYTFDSSYYNQDGHLRARKDDNQKELSSVEGSDAVALSLQSATKVDFSTPRQIDVSQAHDEGCNLCFAYFVLLS